MSDLETKLAEAREQGVQATKEVQRAAQHVILKNGRLRDLLRLAGFSDADIDSWLGAGYGGSGGGANESSCDRQSQIAQKARRCATALAACQGDETAEREWMPPSSEIASEKGPAKTVVVSGMAGTSHYPDADDALADDGSQSNTCGRSVTGSEAAMTHIPIASLLTVSREYNAPIPGAEKSSRTCHSDKPTIPSCKLLTRLAENPAADLRQVTPVPPSAGEELHQDADASHGGGGIECRKAYDMLIQYTTTEEKMDTVARALERGCTKNRKGGCAVKVDVVLQVLDEMCG